MWIALLVVAALVCGFILGVYFQFVSMAHRKLKLQDERARLEIEREGLEAQKLMMGMAGEAFLRIRAGRTVESA